MEHLQTQIEAIQKQKLPRLTAVSKLIDQKETERERLIRDLEALDTNLTARRQEKAKELNDALGGKIKIEMKPAADRAAYQELLVTLCSRIASRDSQIKNKESQIEHVTAKLTPLQLARAAQQG